LGPTQAKKVQILSSYAPFQTKISNMGYSKKKIIPENGLNLALTIHEFESILYMMLFFP